MYTIQSYKCLCCGAPLVFDAQSQNLHCESCDNTFPIEFLDVRQRFDQHLRLLLRFVHI